ncbi:hypothetical protein EC973_007491 [Apophysomyces ossiformis]|uniref:Uncharacterized protein n=1 Tax=Apophysomyces ossiformis TaxID=679940 RepID=A0A8H7ENY5_9FUNG|nr:hypothetical protein EC973_007491 [Apophysomyces ossiformis]
MTIVSRNNALCIFYNEEFTDEAAKRLAVKLDSLRELDICYTEDATKPMLQTKLKINGNPFYYHRYVNDHPEPNAPLNRVMLKNHRQVIDYMNQVYLPRTPPDQKLFENKLMSMKEIYSEIALITDLFDDKSVKSFSTWCGMAKLDFVSVEPQRKYQKNEQTKTRCRLLWVLKKERRESIANKVLNVGRAHKARIEDLKKDGYQVLGYVRKSPGKEDASTRFRLLASMVDRLINGSSVDMVFASYSSTSKEPIASRDRTDSIHVPKTSGTTQDLLRHLSTTSKPIAIVAIDFAGLTTNTNDLIQWIRDHEVVKIVLIDNVEALNQTHAFTREQLLTDISVLQQFDSRPAPIKRSLRP